MTMKSKIYILTVVILILLVGNIVCIFSVMSKEKDIEDCWYTIDSLSRLEYLRYNEESDYYGMGENEILSHLPQPTLSSDVIVSKEDVDEFGCTSVGRYLKRIDVHTPVHIHQYVWKNLITKRNILDVCFAKQDSGWVAVECIEYDTNSIEF